MCVCMSMCVCVAASFFLMSSSRTSPWVVALRQRVLPWFFSFFLLRSTVFCLPRTHTHTALVCLSHPFSILFFLIFLSLPPLLTSSHTSCVCVYVRVCCALCSLLHRPYPPPVSSSFRVREISIESAFPAAFGKTQLLLFLIGWLGFDSFFDSGNDYCTARLSICLSPSLSIV